MATTDELMKLLVAGGTSAVSAVNPLAAGMEIVPEAGKLMLAATQAAKARRLERSTRRPVYAPSTADTEALMTQRNAMGMAPGLQQQAMLGDRAAGSSIAAIQSTGGGMGEKMAALQNVNQTGQEAALRAGAEQDQYSSAQNQNLQRALAQYGQLQEKAWQYNKAQPYEEISAKAAELKNASNMNAYDATKSIGGAVAAGIGFDRNVNTPTTVDPNTGLLKIDTKPVDNRPSFFDPNMPGSEANYNFGEIEKEARVKASGIKFDPTIGADQTYDFSKLSQSELAGPVATRIGGDIEQPSAQKRGLPPVTMRRPWLNPVRATTTGTADNPTDNTQLSKDKELIRPVKYVAPPDLSGTGVIDPIGKSLSSPRTSKAPVIRASGYGKNSMGDELDENGNPIPPYKKPYSSVADPLARQLAR